MLLVGIEPKNLQIFACGIYGYILKEKERNIQVCTKKHFEKIEKDVNGCNFFSSIEFKFLRPQRIWILQKFS